MFVFVQEIDKQKVHQTKKACSEQVQKIKEVIVRLLRHLLFLQSLKSGHFYESTYSAQFYVYICI